MVYHALVLKNYFPKKNKVTILHEKYGKINFFVHENQDTSRLCNGSMMYCDIQKKDATYQCHFIDTYFIPLDQNKYDLYFIHDLLKICLNFVPWQVAMPDIFQMIIEIYRQLDNLSCEEKKIYLLKIFLYIGIFPEDKLLYQVVMQGHRLHIKNIDKLLYNALNFCWNHDL